MCGRNGMIPPFHSAESFVSKISLPRITNFVDFKHKRISKHARRVPATATIIFSNAQKCQPAKKLIKGKMASRIPGRHWHATLEAGESIRTLYTGYNGQRVMVIRGVAAIAAAQA